MPRFTLYQSFLLAAAALLLTIGLGFFYVQDRLRVDAIISKQTRLIAAERQLAAIERAMHQARHQELQLLVRRDPSSPAQFSGHMDAVDSLFSAIADADGEIQIVGQISAKYRRSVTSTVAVLERIGMGRAAGLLGRAAALQDSLQRQFAGQPELVATLSHIRLLERDFSHSLDMRLTNRIIAEAATLEAGIGRRLPPDAAARLSGLVGSYRDLIGELMNAVVELELSSAEATLQYNRVTPTVIDLARELDLAIDQCGIDLAEQGQTSFFVIVAICGGAIVAVALLMVLQHRGNRAITDHLQQINSTLAEERDRAEAANRAKSAFLANMSHELRTPLNAIIGYSDILVEDAEDLGHREMVPDLKKIKEAGNHLLEVITGVLDLSKIEAGQMDLHLDSIDLAAAIREAADTVRPLADKNGNSLAVELNASLGAITTDRTKLLQILYNLLSNACKFTENGAITVSAERGADHIAIAVRDTGIGIDAKQLDHIFESFTQADYTSTRAYGGTGLGLAVTRHFCRMLGGRIAVDSEPGAGSTFTAHLPNPPPPTS